MRRAPTTNRRVTVPNIVTAARIAMAACAAWLVVRTDAYQAAVIVCMVAALLDAADGWYARAFAQCSRVGEHMDPLADKLLMGVVYGWVGVDAASPWVWVLIALVAAREAAMTVFRAYSLRHHGRYIPASGLGRVKMFVQSAAGLGILGATHLAGVTVPVWVVAIALMLIAVLSYASGIGYVIEWKRTAARRKPVEDAEPPRVAVHS
jgi:cardiolipin synthase (CMP-forming)